jgi:hypothetical protein
MVARIWLRAPSGSGRSALGKSARTRASVSRAARSASWPTTGCRRTSPTRCACA